MSDYFPISILVVRVWALQSKVVHLCLAARVLLLVPGPTVICFAAGQDLCVLSSLWIRVLSK